MMVRITNAECVRHLRENPATNTEIVETAICKAYGIIARPYMRKRRGRPKAIGDAVSVKISDKRLLDMLRQSKRCYGVSHHFAVENALLNIIPKDEREAANAK